MKMLVDAYTKTNSLHHGYLFAGEKQNILDNLHTFLEGTMNVNVQGNPDYIRRDIQTFGIDDAREVSNIHVSKSLTGRRIFIITFSFITIEAQNALLKILEEPHEANHFFIIVPTADILLPTVLSRLVYVRSVEGRDVGETEAKKFLKMSKKKRIETVKMLIEEKEQALSLVKGLQIELRADPKKLEMLINSANFLYQRAASVKMILENVALSL